MRHRWLLIGALLLVCPQPLTVVKIRLVICSVCCCCLCCWFLLHRLHAFSVHSVQCEATCQVESRRAYILTTGSTMIDQFEPWYFGVAFAFCFKYCTGMPDMPACAKRSRHRRKEGVPRIELALWVRIMARRVESQLRRHWLSQFTTGNLLFRSAVNLFNKAYLFLVVTGYLTIWLGF